MESGYLNEGLEVVQNIMKYLWSVLIQRVASFMEKGPRNVAFFLFFSIFVLCTEKVSVSLLSYMQLAVLSQLSPVPQDPFWSLQVFRGKVYTNLSSHRSLPHVLSI
jgi:hypothetical protein